MGDSRPVLRPAVAGDVDTIVRWRAELAVWIARAHGSDQWANPFPRFELERAVQEGETWMLRTAADGPSVATITVRNYDSDRVWSRGERAETAWYVHKMMRDPSVRGRGLGAAMLDWAGDRAARAGAGLLRLDAWESNHDLHAYYQQLGFTRLGSGRAFMPDGSPKVPVRLFQRPSARTAPGALPVRELHTCGC